MVCILLVSPSGIPATCVAAIRGLNTVEPLQHIRRNFPVGTQVVVPGLLNTYVRGYYTGRRIICAYTGTIMHFTLLDGQPDVSRAIQDYNFEEMFRQRVFRLDIDPRIVLPFGI